MTDPDKEKRRDDGVHRPGDKAGPRPGEGMPDPHPPAADYGNERKKAAKPDETPP